MQEQRRILHAYEKAIDRRMALATVVKTCGSSYRRPGAQMLIMADGTTIGSVSGGCLEQDVIAHAEDLHAINASVLLSYDTTSERDLIFGVGLGCKGVIEILVEPIMGGESVASADRMLALYSRTLEQRQKAVVATVFRIDPALNGCIGDRHGISHTGFEFSDIRNFELREEVDADSLESLRSGHSMTRRYVLPDGNAEVFIQVFHPPISLVIFGAGNDAIPLSRLAKSLGYHVTVVDRRAAFATKERFPEADNVVNAGPDEIDDMKFNGSAAAVVMSHHYETDRACLKLLLSAQLEYVGLMGPRKRGEMMLQELGKQGLRLGGVVLQKVFNPVGLDIGAETPEQVALSILSEIQAVFSGHKAGFLRESDGRIHCTSEFLATTRQCEIRGSASNQSNCCASGEKSQSACQLSDDQQLAEPQ